MVDQQQPEHVFLVLADLLGGGLDHHAVGDIHRARWLQLRHLLDLDQAHPADRDRRHLRMRAEDRDVDADLLGGVEDERPLGHGHRLTVDGERDLVGLHRGHQATASWTDFLKGQPFSAMCSWNSLRKNLITLRGNQVEASPSGQNERPSML